MYIVLIGTAGFSQGKEGSRQGHVGSQLFVNIIFSSCGVDK